MFLRNLTAIALSIFVIAFASNGLAQDTATPDLPVGTAAVTTVVPPTSLLSVTVLSITSVEGDDASARYLSGEIRGMAQNVEGWSVRDVDVALAQLELVHDCISTDLACLQRIANALQSGSLIFGTMHRSQTTDGPEYVIEMARYDALEMRIIANFTGRVPMGASVESMHDLAQRAVDALALLPAASVADTHETHETHEVGPPSEVPSSGPSALAVAGYSLLGGAVLSLALDIYAWTHIDGLNGDGGFMAYQNAFPVGGDACQLANSGSGDPALAAHARDVCGDANTWETLQYVFLAGWIGLGAGGAALLLMDALTGHDSPVTITPHVSPQTAYVSVSVRL